MKNIKILGTGCPKCINLQKQTETAAHELGLAYEIEKVTDINEITDMGVMITPALVVDGIVKVSGKVPSIEVLKKLLQ